MPEPLVAVRGVGRPPPLLPGRSARRRRGGHRGGQGGRGRRRPGRAGRHARPQGRPRASWPSAPTCGGCGGCRPSWSPRGLEVVDSYVSLTELSEYAQGVPEEMKEARLYPQLPPEGKPAFCFYPMSKRRGDVEQNWFTLPYDERKELMYEHGASGPEVRRPGAPGDHRLDGPRRLRVGRHAVRACTPTTSRRSCTRCASTRRRRSTRSSGPSTPGWSAPLDEVLGAVGLGVDDHARRNADDTQRGNVRPSWRRTVVPLACSSRLVLGVLVAPRGGRPGRRPGRRRARRSPCSLIDRKGTRDRADDEPVEGVDDRRHRRQRTTWSTRSTTDDEGEATVDAPRGRATYTATLDLDSLPDDVGLPRRGQRRRSGRPGPEPRRSTSTLGDRRAHVDHHGSTGFLQLIFDGAELRPDHRHLLASACR